MGDQSRAAISTNVDPAPVQRDCHTITRANQEVDVSQPPCPPGEAAAQPEPAEINDGGPFADGRKTAGMPIVKRPLYDVAAQPCLDRLSNMVALLLGCRRDPRHWLAMPCVDRCGIANDENLGMSGSAEVGLHPHAVGAIGLHTESVGSG